MKQRHRVLAWALAGALVLAGVPVRAEGSAVYVSGSGSAENSGMTEGSPLSSIYAAQELLPEGGTILVTSTIYIAGEREYSLNEGITLQAAEELDGPVFEIAEGGELTLNNIVIVGNSSTLISNSGVLKLDDSVSLLVKDSESVGCVYTAEGAATYLNGELVAGDAGAEKETQSEASETEETAEKNEADMDGTDEEETETVSGADAEQPENGGSAETAQKQTETGETAETAQKQTETGITTETAQKQTETSGSAETAQKQTETGGSTETAQKQPETGANAGLDEKKPETAESSAAGQEQAGTPETKQPETGSGAEESGTTETETAAPIREAAVETVKNAIVALDIHSREDVKSLLPVSQAYDGLTEAEKEALPAEVRQLLESAKSMAAAYNHTQLGVSVYGNLPWYVQFQVKLTDVSNPEENGLKVLVPYELKLWNLYTDSVYLLPEGESVTVTMPVPDVEIDGEFTVFHYKSDGTVESIKPVINGNMMSFETSSFSPFTVAGSTVITGIGIGSVTPSGGGTSAGNGKGNTSETGGSTGSGTGSASETGSSADGSTGGGTSQTGSTTGGSTESSSQTGSTSGSNTGNYNAVAVNTGDTTDVIPAAVTALAALLVIIGIILHKKKQNH